MRPARVAGQVQLDNRSSKEDNDMKRKSCNNEAQDAMDECGSDEATAEQQKSSDQSGFDFTKMMEMMQKCCPDKMKDLSSMKSMFEGGCCSSNSDDISKKSG
jgi:hypothetical protein